MNFVFCLVMLALVPAEPGRERPEEVRAEAAVKIWEYG